MEPANICVNYIFRSISLAGLSWPMITQLHRLLNIKHIINMAITTTFGKPFCYLYVCGQVFENGSFLGRLFLLTANAQVQAHNNGSHQTSLEGIPYEFRCVASDCLEKLKNHIKRNSLNEIRKRIIHTNACYANYFSSLAKVYQVELIQ